MLPVPARSACSCAGFRISSRLTKTGCRNRASLIFLYRSMLLAAAWMFTRFINKIQDDKLYVPRDFCDALFNPGKLFAVARWAIGLLMCLGSVVLLMTSETDVDADFIRIICLLGFLSGLAFPFVLGSANYDEFANVRFVRLCMMMPILLFSAWLDSLLQAERSTTASSGHT